MAHGVTLELDPIIKDEQVCSGNGSVIKYVVRGKTRGSLKQHFSDAGCLIAW